MMDTPKTLLEAARHFADRDTCKGTVEGLARADLDIIVSDYERNQTRHEQEAL